KWIKGHQTVSANSIHEEVSDEYVYELPARSSRVRDPLLCRHSVDHRHSPAGAHGGGGAVPVRRSGVGRVEHEGSVGEAPREIPAGPHRLDRPGAAGLVAAGGRATHANER